MPSFFYPWLAIAGAAAAAVPVIVHLLNRRRYRVLRWAAMDFLREAISRSRRVLELRDVLLLILRVLCLLLFGAAIAKPFWSRSADAITDPNQPVHAVLLIDNSLSMSYEKFNKTVLEEAKTKAREIMEGLPRGSIFSIVPACGSATDVRLDAFPRLEDAIEELTSIKPVDRAARPGSVIDLALAACRKTTSLPARKVFFVTDQQVEGWSAESEKEHLKQLPCPLEVVQVSAGDIDNAYVADVRVLDGVADGEKPAIVLAKIGYQGKRTRENVQVTLKVDGTTAVTVNANLQPGQVSEIQFPEYRFSAPTEPGKTNFASVEVSLARDKLPGDDQRSIVVPVTSRLTVVCVDPLGEEENPALNLYGETYWLRRLLAPQKANSEELSLIQFRHLQLDQLTREKVADARVVVLAGVRAPTPAAVELLTQFVEQGGNVFIAAGGDFDPVAWNEIGWNGGRGILPAPLEPKFMGHLRSEPSDDIPFMIKTDSIANQYFQAEGVSSDDLKGLFGPPTLFFKTTIPRVDGDAIAQASKGAREYFGGQRQKLEEIEKRLSAKNAGGKGGSSTQDLQLQAELQKERDGVRPNWLSWRLSATQGDEELLPVDDLARRAAPVVFARYTEKDVPMLVRRQWGRGKVLMFSTGISPPWTTMPEIGQSWWLMDRIVRMMLTETISSWNFDTDKSFVFPVTPAERLLQFSLTDADRKQQSLTVDALGEDRYGLSLGNWSRRGIYRITARRAGEEGNSEGAKVWEIPVAVNGPVEESLLEISNVGRDKAGKAGFADASSQLLTTLPGSVQGADLWKWLIAILIVLLLSEMFYAAKTSTSLEPAA